MADTLSWRFPLSPSRHLLLDGRYEKMRVGGVVSDIATLSAIGIGEDGNRSILGLSVAPSEAEKHWRKFIKNLTDRGLHGVRFITSDDHADLCIARKAVLPGTALQSWEFQLAQNAIDYAPTLTIHKVIGRQFRAVWNTVDLAAAEAELSRIVAA